MEGWMDGWMDTCRFMMQFINNLFVRIFICLSIYKVLFTLLPEWSEKIKFYFLFFYSLHCCYSRNDTYLCQENEPGNQSLHEIYLPSSCGARINEKLYLPSLCRGRVKSIIYPSSGVVR